jgi:hypothetical protein
MIVDLQITTIVSSLNSGVVDFITNSPLRSIQDLIDDAVRKDCDSIFSRKRNNFFELICAFNKATDWEELNRRYDVACGQILDISARKAALSKINDVNSDA